MRIGLIIACIGLLTFSCADSAKEKKGNKKKELSKKTDLRESMNGYWVLISQSFTRGRKLEKFPVGGSVGIIFTEDDKWYSITRKLREPEDTISYGTFHLERNKIVMEVTHSDDISSYVRLNGKIEINGRFMQLEGRMMYEGDRLAEYTHAIFGKSVRSLEEVFEE